MLQVPCLSAVCPSNQDTALVACYLAFHLSAPPIMTLPLEAAILPFSCLPLKPRHCPRGPLVSALYVQDGVLPNEKHWSVL